MAYSIEIVNPRFNWFWRLSEVTCVIDGVRTERIRFGSNLIISDEVARSVSLEVSAAGRRSLRVVLPLAEECDRFQVEASTAGSHVIILFLWLAVAALRRYTGLDRDLLDGIILLAVSTLLVAPWIPGLAKIKLRPIIKWRRTTERPV